MSLVLQLLGRIELAAGSDEPLKLAGARAQLLLARLALAHGDRLDRGELSAMLWGDRADAQARASLRQMTWSLRQALKAFPDALLAEGTTLRLDPNSVKSDVADFDRLAKSTDQADLEQALALYRGDLLEGIDLIVLAPDGYFLQQRVRLQDQALRIVADLAKGYCLDQNWDAVVRVARRGMILDPFDEALHGNLIYALQKLGRQREARDLDEVFRKRLKAELGVTSPPQAMIATDRRVAAVPALTVPSTDPVGILQQRSFRMVFGLVLTLAVFIAITFGIWRQTSGNSAALPIQAAPSSDRVPTRNLAAYDQYLRAEALRRAAISDDALRNVPAAYRRAFALDADFAEAYAGYALVAVELWRRSLDGPIPSPNARLEAYDSAGHALAIDPGNARALIVLSIIQAEDGAREDALTTARQAVAAEPASAEAHANLALILSYTGNNSEARTELKLLQALDPVPRPEWLLVFGQVAFAEGRNGSAVADFVTLWPMLPKNPLVLEHLAAALALQGRFGQSYMIRDRLLVLMPNANLHLVKLRYAALRSQDQNDSLLEGLRRAGLPEWPYGFTASDDLRVTGPDLAALVGDVRWSGHLGNGSTFRLQSDAEGSFTYHSDMGEVAGHQFLRGDLLCQVENDRTIGPEICGAVYRSSPGQTPESQFVFVSADEVRYFSLPN